MDTHQCQKQLERRRHGRPELRWNWKPRSRTLDGERAAVIAPYDRRRTEMVANEGQDYARSARLSTPLSTRERWRPIFSLAARTSSCESVPPVMPAPGFVIEEKPRHRRPRERATMTSGTVDIPTASAPNRSSIRTSAGVS